MKKDKPGSPSHPVSPSADRVGRLWFSSSICVPKHGMNMNCWRRSFIILYYCLLVSWDTELTWRESSHVTVQIWFRVGGVDLQDCTEDVTSCEDVDWNTAAMEFHTGVEHSSGSGKMETLGMCSKYTPKMSRISRIKAQIKEIPRLLWNEWCKN